MTGRLARNSRIDPAPRRSTHAPARHASVLPTVSGPLASDLILQLSRETTTITTANAMSIDTWVKRPSSAWVKTTTGIRRKAGTGPKYMYVRWSTVIPSMDSTLAGMSQ